MRRRYYWIMALGFLLITGLEMGYFVALNGDPVYRYRIDWNHDALASRATIFQGTGDVLTVTGNLRVGGTILRPILSLLINQEFGLLFWLFLSCSYLGLPSQILAHEERRLLQTLTGLGIGWMGFISYSRLVA